MFFSPVNILPLTYNSLCLFSEINLQAIGWKYQKIIQQNNVTMTTNTKK